MLNLPRPVAYTPKFKAQASGLGLNETYIESVRSMIARARIGKRILKFPFVSWIHQPAGVFQQSVEVEGLAHHRFRYFDFGSSHTAFLVSIEATTGEWDILRFHSEVSESLSVAELIYRQLSKKLA
jgi:hypothetical protein